MTNVLTSRLRVKLKRILIIIFCDLKGYRKKREWITGCMYFMEQGLACSMTDLRLSLQPADSTMI